MRESNRPQMVVSQADMWRLRSETRRCNGEVGSVSSKRGDTRDAGPLGSFGPLL